MSTASKIATLAFEAQAKAVEHQALVDADLWFAVRKIRYCCTDGRRSREVQALTYAIGRKLENTPDGPVVVDLPHVERVTWTLDSAHVAGMGWDAAPQRDGHVLYPNLLSHPGDAAEAEEAFARMVEHGRTLGLVCGADWAEPHRDLPHYEMSGWRGSA